MLQVGPTQVHRLGSNILCTVRIKPCTKPMLDKVLRVPYVKVERVHAAEVQGIYRGPVLHQQVHNIRFLRKVKRESTLGIIPYGKIGPVLQ